MNYKSKTIYKTVAENIKYYREAKGMTISDLAQKTGYTKDFITKLEAAIYNKKCTSQLNMLHFLQNFIYFLFCNQ